jgi:hypothetical protein
LLLSAIESGTVQEEVHVQVDLKQPMPDTFPTDNVIAALDQWWETEKADASLPGDTAPDIMTPAIEIDSHRAVRALISLQEVVGFEIPETVIKNGGYDDFDEMKTHLIPRVQALFDKGHKKQHA